MSDVDEIKRLSQSIGVSRAVRAGRSILEPLETKLSAAARRIADEEAQDLSVHIGHVLDDVPQSLDDIRKRLTARFRTLADARADCRLALGSQATISVARSAGASAVAKSLARLVREGRAERSGWLRPRWRRTGRVLHAEDADGERRRFST